MTTTLITGANKGLGYQTALQLIAAGHHVYIGARDADRGTAAARALGAEFVQIDITSDESVAAAAASIPALDVLVNNAGIPGGFIAPSVTTADDLRSVYETNVFGVVRVIHAYQHLLDASEAPVIVNVSSGLGSLAITTDPTRFESTLNGLAYASSKSALNMVTSQYAKAFPRWRINVVDPGYTATDLNAHRGTQTIEEGAEIIVRMAQVAPDGPTGTFSDRHGQVPW
jgi:NAD(P)-dependent dehydrogenase (short-subunit alcohol dehydrogenase family)